MTQIIIVNDTGAQIASPTEITLDGVLAGSAIKKINSGSLLLLGGKAASALTSTQTTIAATATAPTADLGNYVYLSASNKIKLGFDLEEYHMLILNVVLENDLVRTD